MKHYFNNRKLLTFFIMMALGMFLNAHTSFALTLSPTRFEISGNPGDTLTEEVLITNETPSAENYYSSFANFEAQGDSGTPTFVDPKDDLGTWIKTSESITILPGEQKVVPFTITIPKNAEPGGHFAVIFWGTTPGGEKGVSIGAKTGLLVLLSVRGDVKESAGLLNFNTINKTFWYKTLPVSFEYRFKNDGGDRIKPVGTIKIRDTLFIPTETLDANPSEGNALPNSTRKITVNWVKYERPLDYTEPTSFPSKFWSNASYEWKNFALGLYSAHLNVSYGLKGEQVKKTVFFFVFPWELVIVMIIVLLIVFFGGRTLIRRYNKLIIEKARATGIHLPPESSHG